MGGVLCALAWLAGVAVQVQQAELLLPGMRWAMLAVAALALTAARAAHGSTDSPARPRTAFTAAGRIRWPVPMLACAAFFIAWASTDWRAQGRLEDQLPAALEGRDVQATGVIASLPQAGISGTRFVFAIESAAHRGDPVKLPQRVSLGWYAGFDGDPAAAPPQDLRAGQRWHLTLRLKAPHGNLNPHGFDLELWLFEQGIRASGYVRVAASNRLIDERACCAVQRQRQSIRAAIERWVENRTVAGVLAALAVGDQAAIERDDWELFRTTGVAHLMSISGLHVTMFAWLAGLAVGRLWRFSPLLMMKLPVPLAARWGGLLAAAGYALLAGWGVPAQRTVWMIAAVVCLRTIGWRWPQALVLLAAGLVVIVVDPWAMLQPGFWLSFVAVALLIGSEAAWLPRPLALAWRERLRATLRMGLRTQLVATIGLAPLSMLFFQQVSLIGFVANLIAIPLVTLFITPLALAGVLLPWLWIAAAGLVQGLMSALGWMAQAPWAVWSAAAAPVWAGVSGLAGGAVLVLPLPWRMKLLGVPLLLPLLLPPPDRPHAGEFEAVVVDVGQGTAVLVRTQHHLLVYDAGPSYSLESDAGHRVLLPLLRARGEPHIDRLMLSHRDSDHTGGAASLLARTSVRSMSSSLEAGHPLLQSRAAHEPCAAGQSWSWDGVRFEVLHPVPGETGSKPNHISCVLKVSSRAGESLLLTGDIEAPQEAALVRREGVALKSDVLVVPHHGSRTSSTAAFIDTVAPRQALVQAAYRSRFGHPAPDVVQRYLDRGVQVIRTDRCGAWTWRTSSGGTRLAGVCERQAVARYWHHRANEGLP